ncbi:MAG: molecular chaperone DnaJ [Candidatus Micrarchaeota archaeon]
MAKDYYEILGVPRDAGAEQIKQAYRTLAMEWHPDRNKSKGAEERFKEISEAYAVLSDDQKRRQYDAYGSTGFSRKYTQEDIFRSTDFGEIFRNMGFGESFFGEDFGDLFGRMFFRGGAEDGNLQYSLEIRLEEAAEGAEKELSVPALRKCGSCVGSGSADGKKGTCSACRGSGRMQNARQMGFSQFISIMPCRNCGGEGKAISTPCRECRGAGRVKAQERIRVKVPKGAYNGFALRLRGKGNFANGREGDLYLVISIAEHEYFTREGPNIHYEAKIPFATAVLGGEARVPTLSGEVGLKIPAGTQPGKIFRMHGKGIYDIRLGHEGDEYVRIDIDVPSKITKRQRELLEEFGEQGKGQRKGFFGKLF